MNTYISAGSTELERARAFMQRVRDAGHAMLALLDELERHRSALAELFAAIPDDYDAEEAGRLDNEHTIKRIQEAARGAHDTVDPPNAEPS